MPEPTQTCRTCGDVEVVTSDGRGFPPDIAKRRLAKRCAADGHTCDPQYRAGMDDAVAALLNRANSGTKRYRKRPVEIEAVRFDGSTTHAVAIQHWMETGTYIAPTMRTSDMRTLVIDTLEGEMTAQPGDWIIRGIKGEFYPCKNDVFVGSYDEVL